MESERFYLAAIVSPTTLANFCCYYQRYESLARLFDFTRILVKCRCATVASSIRGVLYSRNILGVEALEDTAETGHRRFRASCGVAASFNFRQGALYGRTASLGL